jgi:uncharacterized protein DUF5681
MTEDTVGKHSQENTIVTEGGRSDARVGYKCPPRHTQFKPAQSGNPGGRPKGRRSFRADIATALDALTDGNKTKQQKLAENLVNDALARNGLAMKIIISIAPLLDHNDDNSGGEPTELQKKLADDFNRRQEKSEKIRGGDDDLS